MKPFYQNPPTLFSIPCSGRRHDSGRVRSASPAQTQRAAGGSFQHSSHPACAGGPKPSKNVFKTFTLTHLEPINDKTDGGRNPRESPTVSCRLSWSIGLVMVTLVILACPVEHAYNRRNEQQFFPPRFLLLVVRPGAPSSVLAARSP